MFFPRERLQSQSLGELHNTSPNTSGTDFLENISQTSRNFRKVDDLVWVLEDFTPRGLWPLAKVIEVHPGSDQIVRSVKVKIAFGEKVRTVIKLSKVLAD